MTAKPDWKEIWSKNAAIFLTSIAIGSIGLFKPEDLQSWELTLTGLAQELRGARKTTTNIAVIAIDDYSLQQVANIDMRDKKATKSLNGWPWPRKVYSTLLRRAFEAGARAVAIDLVFDSPSSFGRADDRLFAETLSTYKDKVVLAGHVLESRGNIAQLALSLPIPDLMSQPDNLPKLGLLNGQAELDGSVRRRPGDYALLLKKKLGPAVPESLAISLMRVGKERDQSSPPIQIGKWLPLLNPYGPPLSIPTISAWELIDHENFTRLVTSKRLNNQLVLLGPSALVLQDIHRTPFSGGDGMSGVELHATELANRIEDQTLWQWTPTQWWWSLGLGGLALGAGIITTLLEKPWQRFLIGLGIAGLTALFGQIAIGYYNLGLNAFSAATAIAFVTLVSSGDATVRLQWQRWRLRQALGRYLSPAVAAEIANQSADADDLLEGKNMDVVILLSDIRGFTTKTREMSDAGHVKDLVSQLNTYFTEMVDAVHNEGGTVDKFIGDAMLAVFGVPYSRGSQIEAAAALRAAKELHQRLRMLNQQWEQAEMEPWQQVVILNFGEVISGNVGSRQRMDYTVIGDAVNSTSRLEYVAKQSGKDLIMSRLFFEQLEDKSGIEYIGDFELRGHGTESVYAIDH